MGVYKKWLSKKRNQKKVAFIILKSLILLLMIGWYAFCVIMYNDNVNIRANSYEPLMLHTEDFSGLELKEYSFPSDQGQMLAGYLYSSGKEQHGIVILAHGFGGGGQNSYMDCADYFARNGYYVFAYDATATDKSEGDGLGGVPQGVIDLEHAISFVEANNDIPDLPIVLFGHSWGGYCVSAVLTYHPQVRAIIACSGFNRSSDMFESDGKSQAGDIIYTMTPFIRMHEYFKYGKYASNTAIDGFNATDAAVMIVHSEDDPSIGIEYGLDKYYETFKNNARFTFIRFENRGHNEILNNPNDTYKEDKAAYINENLDNTRWSHRLDEDLFARFLNFYEQAIR